MSHKLVGVIPAAGEGTRMGRKGLDHPKVLLEIEGLPLLLRNILLMRDQLKIREIFIIAGEDKARIMRRIGDGKDLGVRLQYLENSEPRKGLAHGLLVLRKHVTGRFCVVLADEFYLGSNHAKLLDWMERDFLAVCAVRTGAHARAIKKNYSLQIQDGRITSLDEKPEVVTNDCLGCGTYLFQPGIFDYLEKAPLSKRTKRMELADALNIAARDGKNIYPFYLEGEYVNVNYWDDYNQAKYLQRSKDFDKKRISLIVPAYNEAESIGHVLDDFKAKVHEIIVADNCSADATARIASERGARVFSGEYRGYGDALRAGMAKAAGDILVLTEADGSFQARDLGKILEYMKDADMVVGTRTTKQMIEHAANMRSLPRWGNVALAKFLEILWWMTDEPRLTDLGCTFRGIWKQEYLKISSRLNADGPEFSPEMIIEVMNAKMRLIEIPVSYRARIGGNSKFSGNLAAMIRTGFGMLVLILFKRLRPKDSILLYKRSFCDKSQ